MAWLAREVDAAGGNVSVVGFVVSDLTRLGPHDSPVLGDLTWLRAHRHEFDALALGIGTPGPRFRLPEELVDIGASWPSLIHPSVRMDSSCTVTDGVQVCAGTMMTVNVRLEPYSMVNLSCTLGHEAVLGRGSVLNPTVNLSGGVKIGERVLVGTGAQILQYLEVGAGATVGAGAVVVKAVPEGVTVAGVPARPMAPRS